MGSEHRSRQVTYHITEDGNRMTITLQTFRAGKRMRMLQLGHLGICRHEHKRVEDERHGRHPLDADQALQEVRRRVVHTSFSTNAEVTAWIAPLNSVGGDVMSGMMVLILDENKLHQALALPHAPARQGADTRESRCAFERWVVNQARSVRGDCHVGSGLRFQALLPAEAKEVIYLWKIPAWRDELERADIKLFAIVVDGHVDDLHEVYDIFG